MHEVGKYIKTLRRAQGLSQEELAGRLFVTRQAVSNWENDKTQPDIETLTAMGEIFGVTIDELAHGPQADAFAEGRGRRIKQAAVLVVFTAILWLWREFIFMPYARETLYFKMNNRPQFALLHIDMLLYLLLGAAVVAVLCIWYQLRVNHSILRWGILLFGLAFIFIFALILWSGLFSSFLSYSQMNWFWTHPQVFFLSGFCLFLASRT